MAMSIAEWQLRQREVQTDLDAAKETIASAKTEKQRSEAFKDVDALEQYMGWLRRKEIRAREGGPNK